MLVCDSSEGRYAPYNWLVLPSEVSNSVNVVIGGTVLYFVIGLTVLLTLSVLAIFNSLVHCHRPKNLVHSHWLCL